MRGGYYLLICVTLTFGQTAKAEFREFVDPITSCKVVLDVEPDDIIDIVSWSGSCSDGFADGNGVLNVSGEGKLLGRYDGQMTAGLFEGPGVVSAEYEGGFLLIDGNFVKGLPNGKAHVTWPNGDVFEGVLKGSLETGSGMYRDPKGGFMQASWKDGLVFGPVTYQTNDGELFSGVFENNEPVSGSITYPNGNRYEGPFSDGVPSGQGLLVTSDGGLYSGGFVAGVPGGRGTYLHSDGAIFEGDFKDGYPDGTITVTQADGSVTSQTWKNGEQIE
ncbi:MORN repeat-containing protein [Ruegeria sp. SCP11]|uniref:MORN repeat-containing protein n=1 Tax=Ruegeria sp. SCP11 TaxID=3141378 RepID=UPI00333E0985